MKLVSKLLGGVIILAAFLVIGGFFTKDIEAQASCAIIESYFVVPSGKNSDQQILGYTSSSNRPTVRVRTEFTGDCAGQYINFTVKETSGANTTVITTAGEQIPPNTTRAERDFTVGNDDCTWGNCNYMITTTISTPGQSQLDEADTAYEIYFNYSNTGGGTDPWTPAAQSIFGQKTSFDCKFIGKDGTTGSVFTEPKGDITPIYTSDNAGTTITLKAYYGGDACKDAKMQFYFYEYDNNVWVYPENQDFTNHPVYNLDYDYGVIQQDFEIGTLGCDTDPGSLFPDCWYTGRAKLFDDAGNLLEEKIIDSFLQYENYNQSQKPWVAKGVTQSSNNPARPCVYGLERLELLDSNPDGTLKERDLPPAGTALPSDWDPYYVTANLLSNSSAFNYSDAEPPYVRMVAVVDGCNKVGQSVPFGPWVNNLADIGTGVLQWFGFKLKPTSTVTARSIRDWFRVTIVYQAGDELCEDLECKVAFLSQDQVDSMAEDAWEDDFVAFGGALIASFATTPLGGAAVFTAIQTANALLRDNGNHLSYSCDGQCDMPWRIAVDPVVTDKDGNVVILDQNPLLQGYLESIKSSPCYIAPQTNDPQDYGSIKEDCYALLAPIPGLTAIGVPDENATDDSRVAGQLSLGIWVNRIVTFVIGIVGLAAVIMIVFAGVQYMTTEAIGKKSDAKDRIVQALIGLVIALGIYVILNTINPELLNVDPEISQATLEYTIPDTLEDFSNESSDTSGYVLAGTYSNPAISPPLQNFVSGLSASNKITKITVQTSGPGSNTNGTAVFEAADGSQSGAVAVRFGGNGVTDEASAAIGDNKTPLGTYALTSDIRISQNANQPITTRSGSANLGAAFWMINIQGINPSTNQLELRGIGFHGKVDNTLGTTNGCIRMLNDDLIALSPYVGAGVQVIIQ